MSVRPNSDPSEAPNPYVIASLIRSRHRGSSPRGAVPNTIVDHLLSSASYQSAVAHNLEHRATGQHALERRLADRRVTDRGPVEEGAIDRRVGGRRVVDRLLSSAHYKDAIAEGLEASSFDPNRVRQLLHAGDTIVADSSGGLVINGDTTQTGFPQQSIALGVLGRQLQENIAAAKEDGRSNISNARLTFNDFGGTNLTLTNDRGDSAASEIANNGRSTLDLLDGTYRSVSSEFGRPVDSKST